MKEKYESIKILQANKQWNGLDGKVSWNAKQKKKSWKQERKFKIINTSIHKIHLSTKKNSKKKREQKRREKIIKEKIEWDFPELSRLKGSLNVRHYK